MAVFRSRPYQIAAAAAVVTLIAIFGFFSGPDEIPLQEPPVLFPTDMRVAAVPVPAPDLPPADETATSQGEQTKASIAPAFDEVRRDPDGMTVIAGRAEPGSTVKVIDNGVEIASAKADAAGKFATLAIIPPDGKGQVLSLEATTDSGPVASVEEVILAPILPEPAPNAAVQTTVAVAGQAALEEASPAAENASASENPAQTAQPEPIELSAIATETQVPATEAAASEATASEATATQAIQTDDGVETAIATQPTPTPQVAALKSTAEGVELLNSAGPAVMDRVALDTITYSETGEVHLAGRAQNTATTVRVYLNNNAVVNLPVDETGRWRGDIEGIDTGIYTLRVDELNEGGSVISRVETPFKRESAENLARATANYDGPIKAVTVQEGATLWAIARERYGDPLLYVRVFEANRDNIRDPDLIYPGQIFDLPD